jgi:uncharacterized phage protein gp47/JayE
VSVQVPTTKDLNDQIVDQLSGSLGQTIPILPKAFSRVLAWALAGIFVILFRYCGFIFLQLFVAHATMEETTILGKKIRPLVELGRLFGVGDPYDATRAELQISIPVLSQTGTFAAGRKWVRPETGVVYDVVAPVPLDASSVVAHIRASGDGSGNGGVGDIGNLQPGDKLALAGPDGRIAAEATVVSQLVTAADAETPDHYRGRIADHVRKRPQGGAYADYAEWAFSVPGIVNVYPYAGDPGVVDVYVEADPDTSGDPDGIPTLAQQNAVLAAINLNNLSGKATRRPVGAGVVVHPISREVFDIVVSGLNPDTPQTRDEIAQGIDEYLRSREPFIEGLSVLPRDDRITKAAVGGIVDSVASANGATVTTVELLRSSVPTPAFTLEHGQKAKLGSPSYV